MTWIGKVTRECRLKWYDEKGRFETLDLLVAGSTLPSPLDGPRNFHPSVNQEDAQVVIVRHATPTATFTLTVVMETDASFPLLYHAYVLHIILSIQTSCVHSKRFPLRLDLYIYMWAFANSILPSFKMQMCRIIMTFKNIWLWK